MKLVYGMCQCHVLLTISYQNWTRSIFCKNPLTLHTLLTKIPYLTSLPVKWSYSMECVNVMICLPYFTKRKLDLFLKKPAYIAYIAYKNPKPYNFTRKMRAHYGMCQCHVLHTISYQNRSRTIFVKTRLLCIHCLQKFTTLQILP